MSDADRESFLRAIIAEPGRDDLRLIFADFLDDRGEADRAEFIRVQYELTSLRDGGGSSCCGRAYWPGGCRKCFLRRRERELLDAHRGEWFRLLCRRPGFGKNEPLRRWPVASNDEERAERGPDCPTMSEAIEGTPRRGFVESVTCDWPTWRDHGDAVRACQPVTRVWLTTDPELRSVFYGGDEAREWHLAGRKQRTHARPWRNRGDAMLELLQKEWPGVTFELPPARPLPVFANLRVVPDGPRDASVDSLAGQPVILSRHAPRDAVVRVGSQLVVGQDVFDALQMIAMRQADPRVTTRPPD